MLNLSVIINDYKEKLLTFQEISYIIYLSFITVDNIPRAWSGVTIIGGIQMNNRLFQFILALVVLVLILVAIIYGTKPGSIGDFVWLDGNGNGLQDTGEEGVSGISVTVYNFLGGQVAATLTDANGKYSFTDLRANFYFIVYRPSTNFTFASRDVGDDDAMDSDPDPLNGETKKFLLLPGTFDSKWDAGLRRKVVILIPTKTPTLTPTIPEMSTLTSTITSTATMTSTNTPTSTITLIPVMASCGCYTPGVTFTKLGGGSGGWSDCGQASACHSLIGDQLVPNGSVIGSNDTCSMRVNCPPQ